MSELDKCPSSESKATQGGAPVEQRERDVSAATGKTFWRSLDDVIGTREFRDFVEREFPAYASELLDGSRRHFLKVMGASFALAGVAAIPGCRRPDHRILAYNEAPEDSVPGEPLFFATAMPMPGGGCQGLLAETFDGRPTKLEGNPLHPRNKGKSTVWAQASVLDLYDPERDWKSLAKRGINAKGLAEFAKFAGSHFKGYDATDGAGLAFLVEKATSPSRDALKNRIMSRWPKAQWHVYDAIDRENTIEGTRIAFGRPLRESLDMSKAKVVVSLDRDFLGGDCDLNAERAWAASRFKPGTRPGRLAADSSMSRLYVVETEMTLTGAAADHRTPMRSGQIAAFATALGAALLDRLGGANTGPLRSALGTTGIDPSTVSREWIDAMVEDLLANKGECVVLVGERQDPAVHALGHAINAALGNVGRTVSYRRLDGDAAASSTASIVDLAGSIKSGAVTTLVMIGGNPVFDAPADLEFEGLMGSAGTTVFLGAGNETAEKATWYIPRAHYLEAWGDVQDWDGTYSVIQPMIAPLFGGVSELELLATIAGMADADGYEIVRETVSGRIGVSKTLAGSTGIANPVFESRWRRCLHDGVLGGSEGSVKAEAWGLKHDQIGRALGGLGSRTKGAGTFDVIFAACPKLYDGRWATNAWLQELPQQITKTSWDNPVLVSKKTAEKMGLKPGRHLDGPLYNCVQVAEIKVGGATVEMPIWVQPGLADDTIVLHVGHGRRNAGLVGEHEGVDVYPLRTSKAMSLAAGDSMGPAKGREPFLIANTQDHWAIEGRDIFREIDLYWWQKVGDDILETTDAYGNRRDLNGAQRLGIESHAPARRNVYKQEPGVRGGSIYYHKVDQNGEAVLDAKGRKQAPDNKYGKPVQQWGMSIDLTTCTGCGACTIACQAENNIPVVGKPEVAKGREMHWIRVDRYYSSQSMDEAAFENPDMVIQPIPCMQCEQAPCEVVCPVSATQHGPQGTNDMAYNRCIGTRYCSNNCPYKVRRFNFFDYATKRLAGNTALDAILPEGTNKDLVPPRLREKVTEVESMQRNPHVTVRSRGVMEKCTYCMQRINKARMETKLSDLSMVPDGFFQVACQQACPTDAIVFGDIYDYVSNDGAGSRVYQAKADPRTFAMLAYVNTIPRTTYQLRVRNPNERLRPHGPNPFEHHGHGGAEHEDGHGGEHETNAEGHVMSLPVLSNVGVHA